MKKNRWMVLLFVSAVAGALGADELDNAVLHGATDRRAFDYKPGDAIIFTLSVEGAEAFPAGKYFISWSRTGDDGKRANGREPLVFGQLFAHTTALDRAGFVRMTATVVDEKGKTVLKQFRGDTTTPEGKRALNAFEKKDRRIFFDGSAGVEPEKLTSVPEPEDFDAFWARRRARLAKVPLEADRRPIAKQQNDFETMYAVSIKCAGPRPSTGYLAIPKKPGKYPITVSLHGYGHTYPNKGHVVHPVSGGGDKIAFYFSPHGYELEREPEYYDEFYRSICSGGKTFCFDEKQNADPETSYFSGYTYRLMRALEYLKSLPEWDGQNLRVAGGSMGGMQSLWAAGLDPAVTLCEPSIPWNCDMGGRDTLKRIIDPWYIRETPALRYYDPVNLAKRIPKTCFVNVTRAGLGDYCCPPSGIWAMWNNLSCPKRIRWVQGSTHGYVPSEPHDEILIEEPARNGGIGDCRMPENAFVVQNRRGYNSWPMIQAMGAKLVCTYSRDNALPPDGHTTNPGSRDSYAKVSEDGGRTWSAEVTMASDPKIAEVNEGIGLDSTGAVLAWVRCWGVEDSRRHELYRSADGLSFTKIASLRPDPFPVQVLDPVFVTGLGLVSPWFAGNYHKDGGNSWGILVSTDDGRTWEQRTIESNLPVKEWVTESSIVSLGNGRILLIGRCEQGLGTQFQVTSTDGGKTWTKARTNIGDVRESTPSLIYDPKTGLVANYYYHRGARKLKRRVAKADFIFTHPDAWPEPEVLAEGFEPRIYDAGNVKATRLQGKTDCCAWYTGTQSNATVVVTVVPVPGL